MKIGDLIRNLRPIIGVQTGSIGYIVDIKKDNKNLCDIKMLKNGRIIRLFTSDFFRIN